MRKGDGPTTDSASNRPGLAGTTLICSKWGGPIRERPARKFLTPFQAMRHIEAVNKIQQPLCIRYSERYSEPPMPTKRWAPSDHYALGQ